MKPEFSIILPLYKQENQIQKIVDDYSLHLKETNYSYELILVINGLFDKSFELANALIEKNPNLRVFQLEKTGWGLAVNFGISQAEGELICYTNSARTKIQELIMILHYAKVNTNNVVKANRIIRETFLRRFGSVIYNFENRAFFRTPIWDVNGTPKVFPAKHIKEMNIVSNNDLIDAEIIARCFKKNFPIIEIPILSTERISGKSTTNIRSALKMYFGLFKLRNIIKHG